MGFFEKVFGPSSDEKAMLARAEKASAEAAELQKRTLEMAAEPAPVFPKGFENIKPFSATMEEQAVPEVEAKEEAHEEEMPMQEEPRKAA